MKGKSEKRATAVSYCYIKIHSRDLSHLKQQQFFSAHELTGQVSGSADLGQA